MKKTLLATSSVVAFVAFNASASANDHRLSSIFFKPNQGQFAAAYDLSYNDLSYEASGTETKQYITENRVNLNYGINDQLTVGIAGSYSDGTDTDSDGDNGGEDGWRNPVISLSYRAAESEQGIFDISASYSPDLVDEDSSDFVGDDDDFAGIDDPKANRYAVGIRLGRDGEVKRAVSVSYEYTESYKLSGNDYSSENNLRLGYESQYTISDELTLDANANYLIRDSRSRGTADVDGGNKLTVGIQVNYQVQDDLVFNVGLSRSEYDDTEGSSSTITDAANTTLSAGVKYAFQAL